MSVSLWAALNLHPDVRRALKVMKDCSKKICGHGASVNRRSDVCYLHTVCNFLCYGYPCSKKENMALQCPEIYGIRPTIGRHTSLCILQV